MNPPPQTLYLNENIAVQVSRHLHQFNIPSVHTIDVGNRGVSDLDQLAYASENNYILVTHNRKDFIRLHSEWVISGQIHSGILVLKYDKPELIAQRINKFFVEIFPKISTPFCISPPRINRS